MNHHTTLVLAQINPIVGAIEHNTQLIIDAAQQAYQDHNADLVIFPEMVLSGYPPEDLLLRPALYQRIEKALKKIAGQGIPPTLIIGAPEHAHDKNHNNAIIIDNKTIIARYSKQILPNYTVFDEARYFSPGNQATVVTIKNTAFGILICEDLWEPNPILQAKKAGAQCILSLNASPFDYQKKQERQDILAQRAKETGLPILYANLIGGQDELVFDGGSLAVDHQGNKVVQAPYFQSSLTPVTLSHPPKASCRLIPTPTLTEPLCEEDNIYRALVLGVRDYLHKNGFTKALIGLSGGIDSALTLAIACDAIGAEQITAIMMPSEFTATLSLTGAKQQADTLGVTYQVIDIKSIQHTFLEALTPAFHNTSPDTTEENLQARIRGTLLMALSNKSGAIVLTTGNRSELAVGYSTLYGDMAGGFCVLKDIPKTTVYRLARWRNHSHEIIPSCVIDRAPSAELSAHQTDQDTLPPYEQLDDIIYRHIDLQQTPQAIGDAGHDRQIVTQIIQRINNNEYKRRQAPPGIRISKHAFGKDRRYPITSHFFKSK